MSTQSDEEIGPFVVTVSVGGMTCSSCVNAVTANLSRLSGVLDVNVNLLQNSAAIVVASRNLADVIRDTIDDSGFEASIIEVQNVHPKEKDSDAARTVSFRVDGMFCQNCPPKIMAAIIGFGASVTVKKPLANIADPILTLSYSPAPPALSIRAIMATIATASSPPFKVAVHHPPTVEELGRQAQRREELRLRYRLLFAVIAAIPTFILGVVYATLVKDGNPTKTYLFEPMWVGDVSRVEWALLIIATPVMFYACSTFHRRSVQRVVALWRPGSSASYFDRFLRFGSMNLLVSLGVSVAYFSSIGVLALRASRPSDMMEKSMTYFDTVVFLAMFLLIGKYLQAYCKSRTSDAVTALNSLRPNDALLLTSPVVSGLNLPRELEKTEIDGDVEPSPLIASRSTAKIPVDQLEVGDIVRIPIGSTPPADGIIMPGQEGLFDESSLTGESRIVKKSSGDLVFVGTINKGPVLHVRVTKIGKKTMLDQIVQVVREGQAHRAPIERIADQVTGYFVPIITLLAIITWAIWLGFGLSGSLPPNYLDLDIGGWPVWSLQFAIAVFVVACPCGIGLAAPTALLVGSGLAAKFGILARGGGESFQEMSQLDLVVFDKTGTLTECGPRVTDVETLSSTSWPRPSILGIASELESISTHPLAIAIRDFCKDSAQESGSNFEETPGRGVKAAFPNLRCTAIMGNERWMEEHDVLLSSDFHKKLEDWKSDGKSVVLMAVHRDDENAFSLTAAFAITDSVRSEASAVISGLHQQGIHTWLLSGDNYTTAAAVAASVGIPATNVIAGVLPHEKAQCIQNLQKDGPKRSVDSKLSWAPSRNSRRRTIVAMVGDGINDAPALASADVGIAIGSGSDVALSSASFILLSSDLRSLLILRDLSRRIINRIKFNFFWAIIYNMIAVPIAAGVLYPVKHTRLGPVWASLAMPLSSVSVICSSLLLKVYRKPEC